MRALTRLENKQNYGEICTTYFYLPPNIRKIEKIVFENQLLLMGKYNEFQDR